MSTVNYAQNSNPPGETEMVHRVPISAVFLNDGHGRYEEHPAATSMIGVLGYSDVDNDGDLDAVDACLRLYKNDGTGGFSTPSDDATFWGGDLKTRPTISTTANHFQESPTWAPLDPAVLRWSTTYSTYEWAGAYVMGDLDDDGDADVLGGGLTGLGLYRASGGGAFEAKVPNRGITNCTQCCADPPTRSHPSPDVHTPCTPLAPRPDSREERAPRSCTATVALPLSPKRLAHQLTHLAPFAPICLALAQVSAFTGNVEASKAVSAYYLFDIALGDFDGDGDLDAVIAMIDVALHAVDTVGQHRLVMFVNGGTGVFASAQVLMNGDASASPSLGLGDSAYFAPLGEISVYTKYQLSYDVVRPRTMIVADLNNDGNLDLMIAPQNGLLQLTNPILYGNGNCQFTLNTASNDGYPRPANTGGAVQRSCSVHKLLCPKNCFLEPEGSLLGDGTCHDGSVNTLHALPGPDCNVPECCYDFGDCTGTLTDTNLKPTGQIDCKSASGDSAYALSTQSSPCTGSVVAGECASRDQTQDRCHTSEARWLTSCVRSSARAASMATAMLISCWRGPTPRISYMSPSRTH